MRKVIEKKTRYESFIQGEIMALCGGIVFLFLLCDLARIEGIVYKEYEGKKKTFLRMTFNQKIFILLCK